MDLQGKDWINHIIIAIGVLVGGFIIFGFITQMIFFLGPNKEPQSVCENCLTELDNNYQQSIAVSSMIILEFPSALYSEENLIILQNPSDSLKKIGKTASHKKGNWALQFQALQVGSIDIVIKSNDPNIADYHSILIIE